MSGEKVIPEVKRTSASAIKRKTVGVFAYTTTKPESSYVIILIAGSLVVATGAVVVLQGKPSKDAVKSRRGIFSLPTIAEQKSPQAGPSPSYNKAQDAKNQEEKQKHPPRSERRTVARPISGPQLILPPKDLKIPLGTTVRAVLLSGGADSWVKATVKAPLVINGETLIESGAVILGRGSSTEERLFVHFQKLIRRDGTVDSIEAEAADPGDESMGLKGSRIGSRATKLAASIGLNFITGAAEALQDSQGQQGVSIRPPSAKNAVLQGTARASLSEAQELANEIKNSRPQIAVPVGSEFLLMFTGEGR